MKSAKTIIHLLNFQFKSVLLLGLIVAWIATVSAQQTNNNFRKIGPEDIIAVCHSTNLYTFAEVAGQFSHQQQTLESELLDVFDSPNSSELNQCAAAYYLGKLQSGLGQRYAALVAKHLAAKINLHASWEGDFSITMHPLLGRPVLHALVEIGLPAVPAMIRNLAESDDPDVRDSSLQALQNIENDQDVVKLRLQKALAAEKDAKKQARLQAVLKRLS